MTPDVAALAATVPRVELRTRSETVPMGEEVAGSARLSLARSLDVDPRAGSARVVWRQSAELSRVEVIDPIIRSLKGGGA